MSFLQKRPPQHCHPMSWYELSPRYSDGTKAFYRRYYMLHGAQHLRIPVYLESQKGRACLLHSFIFLAPSTNLSVQDIVSIQNCLLRRLKERTGKYNRLEETKEKQQLKAMWDPRWALRQGNTVGGKLVKLRSIVYFNSVVLIHFWL